MPLGSVYGKLHRQLNVTGINEPSGGSRCISEYNYYDKMKDYICVNVSCNHIHHINDHDNPSCQSAPIHPFDFVV